MFKSALKFPSDKQVKIIKKNKIDNMIVWYEAAKIMWDRNIYLWNMLINYYVIKYIDHFVWEYACVYTHVHRGLSLGIYKLFYIIS